MPDSADDGGSVDGAEPQIRIRSIDDYTPDPENAREHTAAGTRMLDRSFANHGAGRSILVDDADTIVAGNSAVESAKKAGIVEVIEVVTRGDQLVAVKREDVEPGDAEREALALYDNRVPEFSRWRQGVLDNKWKNTGLRPERFGWDSARIKEQVARVAAFHQQEVADAEQVESSIEPWESSTRDADAYPDTGAEEEGDQEWEPSVRDSQTHHITFDVPFDDSILVDQAITLWRQESGETDAAKWLVKMAERYIKSVGAE